jgi:hypothetical protein
MLDEVAQSTRLLVVRLPGTQMVAVVREQFGEVGGVRRVIFVA